MHIMADRHEPPPNAQANQGLCQKLKGWLRLYGSIRVEIASGLGKSLGVQFPLELVSNPDEHGDPEGEGK